MIWSEDPIRMIGWVNSANHNSKAMESKRMPHSAPWISIACVCIIAQMVNQEQGSCHVVSGVCLVYL